MPCPDFVLVPVATVNRLLEIAAKYEPNAHEQLKSTIMPAPCTLTRPLLQIEEPAGVQVGS